MQTQEIRDNSKNVCNPSLVKSAQLVLLRATVARHVWEQQKYRRDVSYTEPMLKTLKPFFFIAATPSALINFEHVSFLQMKLDKPQLRSMPSHIETSINALM